MYVSLPNQLLGPGSPWICMLDITPDVGALGGFFQIAVGRRTVNATTMESPIEVLKFLTRVKQTLHSLQVRAASKNAHLRVCVCVVSRVNGGSVLMHDELGRLITDAFISKAYAKMANTASVAQREKVARRAVSVAQTLVNRLPLTFRPKDRLLKGESPFQVMRLSGFQWMMNWQAEPSSPDNAKYSDMQSAVSNYQTNYAVNQAARNAAWRMGEVLRNAIEDAKPSYIEELKRQREGLVNNDFAPQVGRGDTPTVSMRLRGFDLLLDRAFRRFDSDREGFERMLIQAYSEGLNLLDAAHVRAFVLNYLRSAMPYSKLKNELSLPEPSDRLRMFSPEKKGILRMQLFTPLEPNVPQPDSGTISVLRIY